MKSKYYIFLLSGAIFAADSKRLFGATSGPKELWMMDGARHENFHAYASAEYERRVLGFINQVLAR